MFSQIFHRQGFQIPGTVSRKLLFSQHFHQNTWIFYLCSPGDVTRYFSFISHFSRVKMPLFLPPLKNQTAEIPVENPHFSTFSTGFSTTLFHILHRTNNIPAVNISLCDILRQIANFFAVCNIDHSCSGVWEKFLLTESVAGFSEMGKYFF